MDPVVLIIGVVILGSIVYTLVKRNQGKKEFERLVYKMRTLEEPDQELLALGRLTTQYYRKRIDPNGVMPTTQEGEYNMAYAEAWVLMDLAKRGKISQLKYKIGQVLKNA